MQAIWYGTEPVAALGTRRDDGLRQRSGPLVSGGSFLWISGTNRTVF